MISHDQYFLSSVATEFWAVNQYGQVKVFYDFAEAKAFSYKKLTFKVKLVAPLGMQPKPANTNTRKHQRPTSLLHRRLKT